jgi:GMP synthase (glutamine-hydrolysing)
VAPQAFIDEQTAAIKDTVGTDKAVVALSGGVDSSAVAALAHRAIGDQLVSIFIDDGLMREGEGPAVAEDFAQLGIKVHIVAAQQEFFAALEGLEDPEEKRKAFRDTFYRVLGRLVKDSGARFLLQGTIAADILETQRGVKTQHNILEQIGLDPQQYGLAVIEPLKELFKHQVREVAAALGLPERISQRMPFPGPGLATRVIGEVTPERVETVRKAHVIIEEETEDLKPFQAFAVLLSDRATGLSNGGRAFGQIIVVRCVASRDALTADVIEVPWPTLHRIRERITADVPDVTKVLYDITPKPPSTIEYI